MWSTDPRHSGGMLRAIGRTLWQEGTLGEAEDKISRHIRAYQRASKL